MKKLRTNLVGKLIYFNSKILSNKNCQNQKG